jgi:hypothetical protein
MKRINIHHFPQNPFQEQQQYRHHPYHFHHSNQHHHHHHASYNRRHSFVHSHYGTGGSHYGSIHAGHPHHGFLSSLASRTLKTNFDLVHLSRVRDQLTLPMTSTDYNETNTASSADEPTPPSPSTPPPPLQVPTSVSFSTSVDDERVLTNFLRYYLGRDGVLVLYLLQMNTNEVITGEIVLALFELFKTNIRIDTTE